MDDTSTIPEFLRMTAEQRREAWERNPPRPMPKFAEQPKDEEPATRELRLQIEQQTRAKTMARIEALKALPKPPKVPKARRPRKAAAPRKARKPARRK